jgi:DNA-binding response OmpR family regulator
VTVNLITREVKSAGAVVKLTAREFSLLEYLMRSPGRVYTRTQMIEHVWGYDFDPNTNLVDVHIQRLRKKLGGDGAFIETVRGVGYRVRKEGE